MSSSWPVKLLLPAVLLVAMAATAIPVFADGHHETTGIYVGDLTPGDDGAAPYECGSKDNPCDTLEHGVAHAAAGETLLLSNGVLREGPVTVDKSLLIEGAKGPVKSVLKPAADVAPGDAWFRSPAGVDVEWKMVTFEGAGHQVAEAIRFEGGGQVADSTFKKIGTAGTGTGTAVVARGGGEVMVYKSTFSEIGRSAVLAAGAGQSTSVLGNRITGSGRGEEYGIEVEGGAQADIRNNTISGFSGAGPEGRRSAAIAVRGGEAGTQATVVANELRDGTVGLAVDAAGGPAAVEARINALVGNQDGIEAHGAVVQADENWWGCNGGPGTSGCDGFEGTVEAPAWLTLNAESSTTTVPIAGTATITASVTRDSRGEPVAVPSLPPIEELESERPNEEGVGTVGFADGASVSFVASGGFLTSPVTTAAGAAISTFTAIAPTGTATVRATLDQAVAQVQLQVVNPATQGASGGGATPALPTTGTPLGDRLLGTGRGDWIQGLEGDDLLVGRGGDDRVSGGGGDDTAFGGNGADLLLGGPGDDSLNGGRGDDLLEGGDGADRLVGGPGRDILNGGAGNDRLLAADGKPGDVLSCGPGRDVAIADVGDTVAKNCERLVRRSVARTRAGLQAP